ncbi:formyltransferase family protein [Shewanella litorisediminis]|uniref:Methionyl-tRNA formyltransferase n=1 Tax=Shewanella litorisediminis TaxID=1173586 RepID=A0ABX7FZQ8_9GAMM|nr:formyltransferase family protein [Shewanella litorisediminis]MCL2919630.1 methionyl-tRNA formyltransferase [Shewanella litorisediminis]QRH00521.1 methionyl-tRNA formyltransferase [Shewanella litorisediminis]
MIKVGFVTCVQLGYSCMKAIYEVGGKLDLAISLLDNQAKSKSGRIYLDSFCNSKGIPLLKASHVNNPEVVQAIKDAELDWLFIIGWSQIASQELLEAPKRGVLGMHPTLLPTGRGRAAIPWAILKGLSKTGVTLFKLDSGVDTGPVVDQIEIALDNQVDANFLYQKVDAAHISLIKKVIPSLMSDDLVLKEQDESLATEWPGRKPEDGLIDLKGSVFDAERMVRALTRPYPGAFYFVDGIKVVVWKAVISKSRLSDRTIDFYDGQLQILEYELINVN